jgi:hypothetical protein
MHTRMSLLCLPACHRARLAPSRIALISLPLFWCSCSATRLVLSAAVRAAILTCCRCFCRYRTKELMRDNLYAAITSCREINY